MSSLLNRKAVKTLILDTLKTKRDHLGINRVSRDAFARYEALLRKAIETDVANHPSAGKTFKPE